MNARPRLSLAQCECNLLLGVLRWFHVAISPFVQGT
jgi:hypothetical protein